ncbi:anti-sigma-D factor RsdA [Rhodococcus aetherivorans]
MGRKHGADDDFFADLADDGTPVDIAAVRRDDALIDAISGDGPVPTETTEEYELATLLAGWRAEILADPLPSEPDLDEIVAAVNREIGARDALAERRSRSRTQLRLIRPIAGAAALIAIAVGGATAVSYQAEPGDPLWSVKQVVFSEQAESTVARIDTASTLQEAEQRLAVGDTEGAQELLQSAQERSGSVTDAGQRDQLGDWMQRLTTELSQLLPPPPPPVLPIPRPSRRRWFPRRCRPLRPPRRRWIPRSPARRPGREPCRRRPPRSPASISCRRRRRRSRCPPRNRCRSRQSRQPDRRALR